MNIMHKFKKEQVGDVLQRLMNSGISFSIETNLMENEMGQPMIGNKERWMEMVNFPRHKIDQSSVADNVSAVAYCAFSMFPDSDFAQWYKTLDA